MSASVDIPPWSCNESLRTSWLGPQRLLAFAVKRGAMKKAEDAEKCPSPGKKQGYWSKMVFLPGYQPENVATQIKDGEVTLHAVKTTGDESSGVDKHETIRVFSLPQDVRKKTLRITWLGP